ncbi:endonuclease [Endozoicomonas euniceicola]|uniref:Endonuclease n=1 Tax=Endozoicomonas euniceicola TaxID=1234143 RepID=A0ABY6GU68_9GAMM|nr:endonuclease [Endozoicomonas euniceicola]UYM16330.1 endonuclease [Endozoicomonas euniceicola]
MATFHLSDLQADTVKLSTTGICHPPQSSYYARTKNFTPFETVEDCLESGGRLPKGLSLADVTVKNQSAPVKARSSQGQGGNTTNQSFNSAKRMLERDVYFDHRETLYCGAAFDAGKNVTPPVGFKSDRYQSRARRIEWEHVVPAENFGRAFSEWRDGHPECVDSKGKHFRGRRCAEKMNIEYRYMQSDMYNLFPVIGAVNALRSNYNFVMMPGSTPSAFGSCAMKIEGSKAEPPEASRGRIARSYLYMDLTYPRYQMSRQQRQLMEAWDRQFPVSAWECKRTERINRLQGNLNPILAGRCH